MYFEETKYHSYCDRHLNTVGSPAMTPDAYLMDTSERLATLIEESGLRQTKLTNRRSQ